MLKKLVVKNGRNVKLEDKQFIYNLLFLVLPSNIIDIIIDYIMYVCDDNECKNLYILNGLICNQCKSQYCSKKCYNSRVCNICKQEVCTQLCYIKCCVCGYYYCHECMPKTWDTYQLEHFCDVCYEEIYYESESDD